LYDAIRKAARFWRLFYLLLIIGWICLLPPLQDRSPDKLQNPEFKLMGKLIQHEASIGGLCKYWLENEVVSRNLPVTAGRIEAGEPMAKRMLMRSFILKLPA
jgi:hypothetical protein